MVYKQKSVYQGSQVYKGEGIYNDGRSLEPDDVLVNGRVFKNTFYTDSQGVVQSALKDAITLPAGYIKKDYIYNSNPSSSGNNWLLLTDYYIVKEYGKMYVSFEHANYTSGQAMVVGRSSLSGYKNFQIFHDGGNKSSFVFRNWSLSYAKNPLTSWVFSDNHNITSLSDPSVSYDFSTASGTEPEDIQLSLFSSQADDKFYFLHFVDRNKNVTFTAIPCYDTQSETYGVYDVIAGKFYGDSRLLPSIAPMTLRFKFSNSGYSPVSAGVGTGGTWNQVKSDPNIWDWTRNDSNWDSVFSSAFASDGNLVEVIGCGNTDGITSMSSAFLLCSKLVSVCLFSTKNVTAFNSVFNSCTSLTSIPLFDTGKMVNVSASFAFTRLVASGALDIYNQMSTQATPPSNTANCFLQCGQNTTTGAAEVAQIPSSWGGTGA